MDPLQYVKPNFPADSFAGTAEPYLAYRAPYPAEMLSLILRQAGIRAGSRLLDLASGPGRIALPMASSFDEVWALDLEPEMIEVGRREATRRGVSNIRWFVGRAEELTAPVGHFPLITIGEAFHRLDQEVVARLARRWLRPGGSVALLGTGEIFGGAEPWQRAVTELMRRWWAAGASAPRPGSGPAHNEAVLRHEGFESVATHEILQSKEWSSEAILGYLHSTSVCSLQALGNRAPQFASELRSALGPAEAFRSVIPFGFTIGRTPAAAASAI